jgi:hypothetical protein
MGDLGRADTPARCSPATPCNPLAPCQLNAWPCPSPRRCHALQVLLLVATAEGILYEYAIEDLANPQGPRCALGGEWALLGSAGLAS